MFLQMHTCVQSCVRRYWEARKKKRSALVAEGIVVEGAIELSTGKGPLGGELWKPKYLVFDQRRHRLEVHDPFERPPLKGKGGGASVTEREVWWLYSRWLGVGLTNKQKRSQGTTIRRESLLIWLVHTHMCIEWGTIYILDGSHLNISFFFLSYFRHHQRQQS